MPTYPKLTQVLRVIHDVLDVLCRPQGSYPESFLQISLLLVEIKAFEKSGVQTGHKQGYKQGYAQWVINHVLDVPLRPQASYPEGFKTISSILAEI